ncbi:MAG: 2OG-Fe(II) oxygenase [Chitinophagales bacterium]|nr:2OG-Fe(II) oxygenase [Chitinophagales bacterium]
MSFIDWQNLQANSSAYRESFQEKKPFRYLVMDNFLLAEAAEKLLAAYPAPHQEVWNSTTYIHQKNKLQKSKFEAGSVFQDLFNELNSPQLTDFLTQITGISSLLGDAKLFGGGLHQSMHGAFLNVHVDFNRHPETKFYRRLNLLIYLNKDWKEEYEGAIEFWDMEQKKQLIQVWPIFNRCVVFETNEISFHGHPTPLNTPPGVTRKSLAVYYYTQDAPSGLDTVPEHNTIFKNTEGVAGRWKTFLSGLKAFRERIAGS